MSGYGAAVGRMPPHSADRGVGKASFRSDRTDRPVRRVGGPRTQCPLDYLINPLMVRGRPSRASSSRPSQRSFKDRDATCQRYVRGGRAQQPRTCLASHPRIAGSHGIAQIATGQHDDDEPASPSTPALADSALTARSAGLAHLHSPRALSSVEVRAINKCDEVAFQMTSLGARHRLVERLAI